MKKIAITAMTLIALIGFGATSAQAEEVSLWEQTKQGVSDFADWTAAASKRGWKATKDSASDLADWTSTNSKKAWKATKEGASDLSEWREKKSSGSSVSPSKPNNQATGKVMRIKTDKGWRIIKQS